MSARAMSTNAKPGDHLTAAVLAKRLKALRPLLGRKALAKALGMTVPILDLFCRQDVTKEACAHFDSVQLAALEEACAPALQAHDAAKRAARAEANSSFSEGVMRNLAELARARRAGA